jgi:hypothetical protein
MRRTRTLLGTSLHKIKEIPKPTEPAESYFSKWGVINDNMPSPDQVIDDEYIAKKYPSLEFKDTPAMIEWIGRAPLIFPWIRTAKTAEENKRITYEHLKRINRTHQIQLLREMNSEPTNASMFILASHKYTRWIILFGCLLATPITIYFFTMRETEFHAKRKWLDDTIYFKRTGPPYATRPWDAVRKGSDGHYYIGKERVD